MRRLLPLCVLLLSACGGAQIARQKKDLDELREKAGALLVQVKERSDEADAAKAAKADAEAKLADAEGKLAIAEARIESLTQSNRRLSDAVGAGQSELGGKLNAAVAEKDALAKKLADAQKERLTLERVKNVYRSARDKAAAERDALAAQVKSAQDASAQSAEERAAAAAKTRDDMGAVADAMLAEMQAGKVSAAQAGASFSVTLSADALFDEGSAKIGDGGAALLEKLGRALKALGPRDVEIEAYADNAPVKKGLLGGFEDSWALTATRAAAVARWLHAHAGLDPARLNAEGYGEFRPLKPNDSAEGRAANRRVVVAVERPGTP